MAVSRVDGHLLYLFSEPSAAVNKRSEMPLRNPFSVI
jgi:hypothetical protein